MPSLPITNGSRSLSEAAHRLKRRVAALLVATALIVIGSHVILDLAFDARSEYPAVVDLAGRQRMLSQRILAFAEVHVAGDNLLSRGRLVEAIDNFVADHEALMHDTDPERIDRPLSGPLLALLAGRDGLEARHHDFAERARSVADWEKGQPVPRDALDRLALAAGGPLLDQLDAALALEVRDASAALATDRSRTRGLGVLGVLGIGLLGLLVVRPLLQSMQTTSAVLRTNEDRDARRRVWQRDFAAIADHELRSPVTVITGLSLTLHRHWDMLDHDARIDIVRRLAEQGATMAELLDELSTVAGLARPADVGQRIQVADLIEEIRGGRGDIVAHPTSTVTISADPRRVRTLIRELVDNGLEHGAAPVTVGVARRDADLFLIVTDAGDGIPADDVEELLQPFSLGAQSAHHGGVSGRGLGLSMVSAIVDEFDGDLNYDPVHSSWRIRLPGVVVTDHEASRHRVVALSA